MWFLLHLTYPLTNSLRYVYFKILMLDSFSRILEKNVSPFKIWNKWPTGEMLVTWAAMTLCLSTMSLHLGHWQSLQLQKRLCPFRGDTKPWFLQREHLGILGGFGPLLRGTVPVDSALLCFSLLIPAGHERIWFTAQREFVAREVKRGGCRRSPTYPALLPASVGRGRGWKRGRKLAQDWHLSAAPVLFHTGIINPQYRFKLLVRDQLFRAEFRTSRESQHSIGLKQQSTPHKIATLIIIIVFQLNFYGSLHVQCSIVFDLIK